MKPKQKHSLMILLVVLILTLITLVTFHIRQWRQASEPAVLLTATPDVTAPEVSIPVDESSLVHVTLENVPSIEARNLAQRPAVVPDALDSPVEIRQALQRQTRNLLDEALSQEKTPVEDRRALAISKEDALQLQQEGRMAF